MTIDTGTGAASTVGPLLGFGGVFGLAADADGSLFGTDFVSDELLSVRPVTGAASVIGSHRPNPTTNTALANLTFAPDGTLFATDLGRDNLVTVNPTTGALKMSGRSALMMCAGSPRRPRDSG